MKRIVGDSVVLTRWGMRVSRWNDRGNRRNGGNRVKQIYLLLTYGVLTLALSEVEVLRTE